MGVVKTKCHWRGRRPLAMTFYAHHGTWRATHHESFLARLYHGQGEVGNEIIVRPVCSVEDRVSCHGVSLSNCETLQYKTSDQAIAPKRPSMRPPSGEERPLDNVLLRRYKAVDCGAINSSRDIYSPTRHIEIDVARSHGAPASQLPELNSALL